MKKLILFFFSFILLIAPLSFTAFADEDEVFTDEQIEYYANLGLQGTTVNVYNWGEYISDGAEDSLNVVKEFERLTGAKVNYTNYESNENMYSKLMGGGVSYDVIVPSDYMVGRLIEEDMLVKIDWENVPNLKYIAPEYQNLYFDPNQEYSICYNVGTTVIIYNTALVDEKPTSWKILWDSKYKNKILMFNNSRDAFAIAQAILGQSLNTVDEAEWNEAAKLLAQQKDTVNPVYVMDEIFNLMESGEYAFATYYAGDYVLMCENNPDLACCFPEEGVNIFFDAFCIPNCVQNKKGAEAFINFMHEPQIALANAEYIYYASPNLTVINNEEYSLFQDETVYPEVMPEGQYFENLPQNILELQADLWTGVKSGQLSEESESRNERVYIESGILAGIVVCFSVAKIISNNKKKKIQDLSDLYEK
ncbi:MAG: spermidine/putrescine ABC transporter substrate-binding protein [Eubacterium sp.]|nr:spermidine/putrescine ABC transporter substrate-binding protein [Eubacterium sp.]